MEKYKVKVAFQAVDTVTVWANDYKEARYLAVEELSLSKGLDIISGSYDVLEVTKE